MTNTRIQARTDEHEEDMTVQRTNTKDNRNTEQPQEQWSYKQHTADMKGQIWIKDNDVEYFVNLPVALVQSIKSHARAEGFEKGIQEGWDRYERMFRGEPRQSGEEKRR